MALDTLTPKDRERMSALNHKNGWGITTNALIRLIRQHRAARERGDTHQMELIEYRLTDINFHREVEMLMKGEYKELLKEQKGEKK